MIEDIKLTGIYCYTEGLTKSSSVKGPFSVDNVCLRPHIPYDHCPVSSNSNHTTADNEGEILDSDYDYDSTDENFSVTHKNSSSFSGTTYDGNRKRNNLRRLRKHKKLSKILCVS